MGFSGGDPVALRAAARALDALGQDLAQDSVGCKGPGSDIAGAAPGEVGVLAENAIAAAGGAVAGAAVLVSAMGTGSDTAGQQLDLATGGQAAR